jgi:hypothetical protein
MKAETAYNLARAVAVKMFDTTTEEKAIELSTTVLNAEQGFWNTHVSTRLEFYPANAQNGLYDSLSSGLAVRQAQYDTLVAAANAPLNAAVRLAKVTHAANIGTARKTRSDTIADAKKTRETDAGAALVKGQNDLNSAEGKYVAEVNPIYGTYASTAGGAERDFTKNEAKLDVGSAEAAGDHDVTFAQAIATANTDYAREVAKLEIDYHTGTNSLTLAWCGTQLASTTNPQPTEYSQYYLQEQARQAWLVALKDDYATFAEAMADAAGDDDVARVQAAADFSVALAENAAVRSGADADRWYDEGVDETAASGAYDAAETGVWNTLRGDSGSR